MYEGGGDYGLYERILNGSDAAEEQNRHNNYRNDQPDKGYCQICANKKYGMYTVSENCKPSHLFCLECLSQKLEECIANNQEMYCLVDGCPYPLSENSIFFSKLNNKLHNKYVAWKVSDKYMARNQSLRDSKRQSFSENYFGNYFNLPEPNLPVQELKENDVNEIKDVYQNDGIKQKKKSRRYKQPRPKKARKSRHAIVHEHEEQAMLPAPIHPPIPFQYPAILPVSVPVVAPVAVVAPVPAVIAPVVPPPVVVAPVAVAAPAVVAPVLAHQQAEPVPYTCCRRIAKFLYVAFGLPAMFVTMAGLMVMMAAFYTFVLASFVAPIGCIVFAAFYAMQALTQYNQDIRKEGIIYSILLTIGALISTGMARFLAKYMKYIYNLVIKNSWIWWISKIIKIWAYPNPPPVVLLEPRRQQQPDNRDLLL